MNNYYLTLYLFMTKYIMKLEYYIMAQKLKHSKIKNTSILLNY